MLPEEDKEGLGAADFFPGPVYSTKWLHDSVAQGSLLQNEEYKVLTVDEKDTEKRLITSAKTKYTLREVLILKNLAAQATKKSLKFWAEVEERGALPCRTAQSMFTWSKTNAKSSTEELLAELESKQAPYCFSFATPPRPHEPLPSGKPKGTRYAKRSKNAAKQGD